MVDKFYRPQRKEVTRNNAVTARLSRELTDRKDKISVKFLDSYNNTKPKQ